MNILITIITALAFIPASASAANIQLNIASAPENQSIKIQYGGDYRATETSYFCTRYSIEDGKRVPKTYYDRKEVKLEPNQMAHLNVLEKLKKCKAEIRQLSISASLANRDYYNTVGVLLEETDQNQIQEIGCSAFGRCDAIGQNVLHVGPNGILNVLVKFEK